MARDNVLFKSFVQAHPLDAARTLERLPEKLTASTLEQMDTGLAAQVFEHMSASQAAKNILLMQATAAADIIEAMSPRNAGRVLRKLAPAQAENLLTRVNARIRLQLARQLRYPADTVAAIMNPAVFTLPNDITVSDALKRIERDDDMFACDLYLVDTHFKPVGLLQASSLLRAAKNQRIVTLANNLPPTLPANATVAAVRELPAWNDFQSLPVVEKDGTLIGTVYFSEIQHEENEAAAGDEGIRSHNGYSLLELCWVGLAELMNMIFVRHPTDSGRSR